MGNWYDPYLALGDPVIVTDSSHRILAVNEAYEHASGYRLQDLVGNAAGKIKSGLTPQAVYDSLKKALDRFEVWRGIFTNRRPDGYLWNSYATITPMRTPDGDIAYVGICRNVQDITSVDIAQSYKELFKIIAKTAESTDPMLEDHLTKVGLITELIARAAGLPEEVVHWLAMGSYLHDVGKLFIPKEILFKPGRITREEREYIKAHTKLGESFLVSLHGCMAKIFGYNEALVFAKEMAGNHHERFDGKGYPKGLKGYEIPLSARIIAIADVVDALLSRRPYKEAWSFEEVRNYLIAERGKQFDPDLVDGLLHHWDSLQSLYSRENVTC